MSLEQSVTALEQRNAELVSEVVRARDAVMGLSNMYTTITLGLAGTEDGQYFTVPGNGAYQKLYQHDGAQAPLIATYPNKSDLTDALTTLNTAMSDHVALPDPHSQYAELSGGASANFTAMPQVGGDPIVESGSNADGEWTRWADGAQIVTAAVAYTDVGGFQDFNSPAVFLSDIPDGGGMVLDNIIGTPERDVFPHISVAVRGNTTAWALYDSASVPAWTGDILIKLFATGRWK